MAHKTLINGTAYEITSGKTLVNGTSYDIACGKTLVGGTAYDISFGTRLGDLPVGNSVFLTVNGSLKEFLIVNQGKPSSLYDDSCNDTWLLMKDCYEKLVWDSSRSNKYATSSIHTYLNNNFLSLFDSDTNAHIKTVKIPYGAGGSTSTVYSGSNGLSTKVFLLSGYEVGFTTTVDGGVLAADGTCLDYFNGAKNSDRIAYLSGSAVEWWLRTPVVTSPEYARVVWGGGDCRQQYVNSQQDYGKHGVRPAIILSSDLLVDKNNRLKL